MITHLLRCHLMMEPISVAAWRQLPSLHPVWKLLFPHIKGVLAINTLGRGRLIAKGGVSDQTLSIGGGGHVKLMQKYYRSITWGSYDLPKMLKERGVDDSEKLPRFYYRDDALSLWNAIATFVKEILDLYYSSDSDVAKVSVNITKAKGGSMSISNSGSHTFECIQLTMDSFQKSLFSDPT